MTNHYILLAYAKNPLRGYRRKIQNNINHNFKCDISIVFYELHIYIYIYVYVCVCVCVCVCTYTYIYIKCKKHELYKQ